MKKTIKIIIYFIISIVLLTTCVNAEGEACKITLTADKTTLNPGDEVTIMLLMSNITKSSGITQFLSVIEYSEDIFEVELVEDKELSASLAETEFKNCDIIYSSAKDTDLTIKNPMVFIASKESGQKGIIGSTSADPQIETQVVGKIKLKVKNNIAQATTTTISLKETEAFDAEAVSNNANGYKIADSSVELKINANAQTQIPGTSNNNNSNNNGSGTTSGKIETIPEKNISKNEVPYTGVEDYYVPVIAIIAIASIIAYANYKKYKNI